MFWARKSKSQPDPDSRAERGELSPALHLFGRALAASPLEVGIGLAVALIGVVVGGVPGQLLTGLAGILISYSMTLRVAEERAQVRQEEKTTNLREREIGRLRGIYRQIYNTHIQILNATSEPDDTLASFALITQSNRNLFFLLTEIETIVGETDIRVASLANRLRSNIQEMDVLLETVPGPESVERLEQLELEQRDLKRQLASISDGATAPPPSNSSHVADLQQAELTLSKIVVPTGGIDEWTAFLRLCIERLAEVPEIDVRLRTESLPLTMFGHALRRRTGHQLPSFPGYRGLSGLLIRALRGTRFCVVMSVLDSSFRGVAIRDSIPSHLEPIEVGGLDDEAAPAPAGVRPLPAKVTELMPELVKLPRPAIAWGPEEWATYMREVVVLSMGGQLERSLQQIGNIFKALSELKPPPVSGLLKFHAYLQLALSDSEYCVIQKAQLSEMAVVPRSGAAGIGEPLPDLVFADGKLRIKDPEPGDHGSNEYRRILRNAVPPLSLPQDALPAVVRYLGENPIQGEVQLADLTAAIADEVPLDIAPRVRPGLILLGNCGVLEIQPNGFVGCPEPLGDGDGIIERVEDVAAAEIADRLGSVDRSIVKALARHEPESTAVLAGVMPEPSGGVG